MVNIKMYVVFILSIIITPMALAETHKIKVISPVSVAEMMKGKGKPVTISLKFSNMDQFDARGIALIMPSSTKNMEDERDYAKRMAGMGFATVIVDGVTPRFKSKFSKSYTSAMVVADLAAAIAFIDSEYGTPKQIVALGSSTGSLALIASQMKPVVAYKPALGRIDDIFMLNAACPDKIEAGIVDTADIYTVNGLQDDSTVAFACENTKRLNDIPNLTLLTYEGGHHFMSRRFHGTKRVNGKHLIPTCSLNYDAEGYMYAVNRSNGAEKSEQKVGHQAMTKWVLKTCLRSGHLQGYVKASADQFWADVARLVSP